MFVTARNPGYFPELFNSLSSMKIQLKHFPDNFAKKIPVIETFSTWKRIA